MGISQIIDEWLKWRRNCVCRELRFNLDKMKKRLHLLDGLAVILLDIDKAIKIIRETELEADVIPNLMNGFGIDEEQAEYVAEIKLRNINKQYILNRIADRDKLKADIADTEDILGSPRRINGLIVKTLREVAEKYGQPRKSEIVISPSTSNSFSVRCTTSCSTWSVSSQISPTICSRTSSMETTPRVPPYSSETIARCCFSFRRRSSTSGSFIVL
jgi:DNA gyrase/topoisomerase IV subunit A